MNTEQIAEAVINRCDGIVTMDSDQRRECKTVILATLNEVVAGVIVAANPADDATEIDVHWLDRVLGPEHRAPLGAGDLNIYGWGEAEIIVQDNGHGGYGSCKHVIGLPDCKTRGDVRRLCQALGVQLSEAPCSS